MDRSDLEELHYITPIANVPSILARGILSFRRAQPLGPHSVASTAVQARRKGKRVPGGRLLHEYANLYICARNPMLYVRSAQHQDLCVLRVSTDILDAPGAVIADGNAASEYTAFGPSPDGLARIDRGLVFAEYWTDPDQIEHWRKARAKCAEVLVPDRVDAGYVDGVYVSCEESKRRLRQVGVAIEITVDRHLFFQG